jgi:DNA-binding LacI/PurR family transcriptional regulator
MADIAEMTGVSVPPVSKVVNGRKDVSAETRSRVEAAIREHGYQRSAGSRSRAPLLEVIFHELESEWALEIVRGVERVAGQHHLAVVLSEMQGRRSPGRGWIEGVLARRPTGVIARLPADGAFVFVWSDGQLAPGDLARGFPPRPGISG